jgi:hypothetical protein
MLGPWTLQQAIVGATLLLLLAVLVSTRLSLARL